MQIIISNEKMEIIPIKTYPNADLNKFFIYKQNKGKSDIYRWNNILYGKSYVGSAKCLRKILSLYYSLNNMNSKRKSSAIYAAILKYGHYEFSLDILEYCDPSSLIEREQYYLDKLNPEYNILKIAGSRLGTKHSDKPISLLRIASTGRKHTKEAKLKMRELAKLRIGKETSFYGKNHKPKSKLRIYRNNSIKIKIEDIELGINKLFIGNKQAAEYLNIGTSTLRRYKKLNKIIKGRNLISNL